MRYKRLHKVFWYEQVEEELERKGILKGYNIEGLKYILEDLYEEFVTPFDAALVLRQRVERFFSVTELEQNLYSVLVDKDMLEDFDQDALFNMLSAIEDFARIDRGFSDFMIINPDELLYLEDLPENLQGDFDYIGSEEKYTPRFFNYKAWCVDAFEMLMYRGYNLAYDEGGTFAYFLTDDYNNEWMFVNWL